MDSKHYLASALSENATQIWTHHSTLEKAEPYFAKLKFLSSSLEKSPPQNVSSLEVEVQSTHPPPPSDQLIKTGTVIREGGAAVTGNDTVIGNKTAGSQGAFPDEEYTENGMECSSKVYLARCLSNELQSQLQIEQAVEAEARFMEVTSKQRNCTHLVDNDVPPPSIPEKTTSIIPSVEYEVVDEVSDPLVNGLDAYLSLSLVGELNVQQSLVQSLEAETKFAEITTASVDCYPEEDVIETLPPSESSAPPLSEPLLIKQVESVVEKNTGVFKEQVWVAESLSNELKSQQSMAQCCDAERKYIEVVSFTGRYMQSEESDILNDNPCELNINISVSTHGQLVDEVETVDGLEPTSEESRMESVFGMESGQPSVEALSLPPEASSVPGVIKSNDQSSFVSPSPKPALETHLSLIPVTTTDVGTNTDQGLSLTQSVGINTDSPPILKEVGCNTSLSCFDLLRRAKEMEEFEMLKAEHHVIVGQLNQQRSQRMVAEQLVKIVQSDLSDLQQKHVYDVTTRMGVENELGDAKAELSYANRQLQEKEERIKELEDSLTGTSILVRKLEEQNAVTLMNRGGIDYMLQAKLAEGRAREAEQKLEVLQSELLQSQGEVRLLLDRVGEASRDRSEMISSKVHTQLLQVADDRAMSAERQTQALEREVRVLQERLSSYERDGSSSHTGSGSGLSSGLLSSRGVYGLETGGIGLGLTSPLSAYSPYTPSTGLSSSYGSMLPSLGGSFPQYKPMSASTLLSTPSIAMTTSNYSSSIPTTSYYSTLGGLKTTNEKTGIGSHDISGSTRPTESTLLPSSIISSKVKSHDFDSKPHDFGLVSHDTSDGEVHLPPPTTTDVKTIDKDGRKKDKPAGSAGEGSDSSDWSSSEDGEDGGGVGVGVGEGGVNPLAPSSHVSLIAEWEWRAMNKDADSGSHPVAALPYSPPFKKRPPPIAPKPKHLSKPSGIEAAVLFEPPSSFNDVTREPALSSSAFRRPKGPRGRKLPVRFSKQVLLFT